VGSLKLKAGEVCWKVDLHYIKHAKDFHPTKTCVFVRDDNPVTAGKLAATQVEKWLGKTSRDQVYPKALSSSEAEFIGLPEMSVEALPLADFIKLFVRVSKYNPLVLWSDTKPPEVVCFWGMKMKADNKLELIGNVG